MTVPPLKRRARLPAGDQERIGKQLLARYEAGSSIRQLCAETGYSIGRVRRLLEAAGVNFRPRGGARRGLPDS